MSDSLLARRRADDPSATDLEHVADLAAEAVAELGLSPPVDLRIVASYFGIGRVSVVPMSWAGCLVATDELVEIKLRASDSASRQRFTGFHEVTHTFMPGYRLVPQYRCDPQPSKAARDELETLCDAGASEFLLPAAFLRGDLAEGTFGLDLVEELADYYEASLEATAHRMVDFWPEDMAFLALELRNKPRDLAGAEPKLRVNTIRASTGFPYVPRHKSLDIGSLAEAADGATVDEWLPELVL